MDTASNNKKMDKNYSGKGSLTIIEHLFILNP